jgi:hypothetical protein
MTGKRQGQDQESDPGRGRLGPRGPVCGGSTCPMPHGGRRGVRTALLLASGPSVAVPAVGAAIMDPAHQGLRRVLLGVDLQRRCARHGNAHVRSGDHKLTASPTVQLLTVPSRTP